MPYYRLYFLEGFSGHIDHFREFEADGDDAALARSNAWRERCPMELWAGPRKVHSWAAVRPTPVEAPPAEES